MTIIQGINVCSQFGQIQRQNQLSQHISNQTHELQLLVIISLLIRLNEKIHIQQTSIAIKHSYMLTITIIQQSTK